MTTVIIPTRGRPDMLHRCLNSMASADSLPRVIVVADDCMETEMFPGDFGAIVSNTKNIGFWASINKVLDTLPLDEPFVYIGKDVIFHPGWLREAESCWRSNFPDDMGLLTFKDDIQNGFNASHGMSTRQWLRVVYGEPSFPTDYFHYFCDSEFTNRSRDLGRFVYCEASYVEHQHEPSGHTATSEKADKVVLNARHHQWVGGGLQEARARLKEQYEQV